MKRRRAATSDYALPPEIDRLVRRLSFGEPVFGRRLFMVGSGQISVSGASGGALCLDERGDVVLIVFVPDLDRSGAAEVSDEVDRISLLRPHELTRAQGASGGYEDLVARYSTFFAVSDEDLPRRLNARQSAIVVVDAPPSVDAWRSLIVEMGSDSVRVYERRGDDVAALEPPAAPSRSSMPPGKKLGIAGIAVGVAIAAFGFARSNLADAPVQVAVVGSAERTVAVDAPGDATFAHWIDQQRLVRSSTGALFLLYRSHDGLAIASDGRNQGRTWGVSATLEDIHPTSLSVAIDTKDRIHAVVNEGDGPEYLLLHEVAGNWEAAAGVDLGGGTPAQLLDVAWDRASRRALVLWGSDEEGIAELRWSVISVAGRAPRVVDERLLLRGGSPASSLAGMDVDGRGRVLVAYRRPDRPEGWYARLASWDGRRYTWAAEEVVSEDGYMGAVSLVFDRRSVPHLVLRDSSTFGLVYFTRRPGSGWSAGEVVYDVETVDNADHPSLSVDPLSDLVYLFFQTDRASAASQVQAFIRDPSTGWEGPYPVPKGPDLAEPSMYPVSAAGGTGGPLVAWTKGGDRPEVRISRVVVP